MRNIAAKRRLQARQLRVLFCRCKYFETEEPNNSAVTHHAVRPIREANGYGVACRGGHRLEPQSRWVSDDNNPETWAGTLKRACAKAGISVDCLQWWWSGEACPSLFELASWKPVQQKYNLKARTPDGCGFLLIV